MMCGRDINNDEIVDQDEMAACTGENNNFCPIEAVDCTATYGEVICPSGSTLNPSTDKCEAEPDITCATGYTYDTELDRCLKEPDCPYNGILNPIRDMCEIAITDSLCPSGYTYDATYNACIKDIVCSNSGTYNSLRDFCELPAEFSCPSGYTYNSTREVCETNPTCSDGSSYNTSTNRCEQNATTQCPTGYTYNSSTGRCEVSVTCPSGSSLNASTDKCEATPTYDCPDGYTLNGSICQADPTCLPGTSYNATYDKCVLSSDLVCSSGTYDSTNEVCYLSASCPNGTLNTSRDKCEVAATYSCTTGYTYNASTGKCETNPTCPSDFTYSATYDRCLKTAYAGCPTGYTYNSSRARCEKAPECASSGTYDTFDNICVLAYNTRYICSLTGTVYATNDACVSACSQTTACTESLSGYSLSGCASAGGMSICGSGGTLWISMSGATSAGAVTVSASGLSGCAYYTLGAMSTAVEIYGSGNTLKVNVFSNNFQGTSAGAVTVSASGLSGCAYSGAYGTYSTYVGAVGIEIYGSGNTLKMNYFSGSQITGSGAVTFTPAYSYSCPYGSGYTCDANHNCTKADTCSAENYCVSGYTLSGSRCVANVTCSSGGALDGTNDVCYTSATSYTCDSGYTYDSTIGACVANATCSSSGTLNTSTDKCELPGTNNCISGYTYNSSLDLCQMDPQCSSGSYVGARDRCELAVSYTCSQGTYNSTSGLCEIAVTCSSDGALNGSTDKCEITYTNSCPTDTTYNSSTGKCEATPSCPSGGSYDISVNLCTAVNTWVCPSDYTLTGSICYISVVCPSGGTLNGDLDVCEAAYTGSCADGYVFNVSLKKCESVPVCGIGTFDPSIDKCKVVGANVCPSEYTFNDDLDNCQMTPPCPSDALYSVTVDMCARDANHDCPVQTIYVSLSKLCEAAPVCTVGTYNSEHDGCYEGDNGCPIGSYTCMDNGSGVNQCSPNPCVDVTIPANVEITNIDDTMLMDDGERDAQGNCLGEIYVFTGRGIRCRTSGVSTGFVNCCNQGDAVLKDSVGSVSNLYGGVSTIKNVYYMGQIAYYGAQAIAAGEAASIPITVSSEVATAINIAYDTGSLMPAFQSYATTTFLNPTTLAIEAAVYLATNMLFSGSCDQQDLETAMMSSSGRCHYVGSYCTKKWPLVGCVQRAKGYCCFNSKLARIIHEQGRSQLRNFQSSMWGMAEAPYCRGFTADEFQMLDFSKIDLSEYFGDIKTKAQSEIIGTANDRIQQFYDRTQ